MKNERLCRRCQMSAIAYRLTIVVCLVLGGRVSVHAEAAEDSRHPVGGSPSLAAAAVTNLPPLLRPVTLKDDDGNAEVGLVDPFRRRSDEESVSSVPGEDGLMRTTMGEISSEFRILAITIPADTNTPPTALIQFYTADEPILVHEGDLVRVDRLGASGRRGRAGQNGRVAIPGGRNVARRAGVRSSQVSQSAVDVDLEEQLRKFVFYVNVKHIEPTYIEVYHNKKRPDETIRLNW